MKSKEVKEKVDGTIERHKVRLVAKGLHQREGQNFDLAYSLVAKATIIRTIFSIVVSRIWALHHLDVCNVFLNGTLEEIVHKEKLTTYRRKEHPHYVCKLHQALYKLIQTSSVWYHKLKVFLKHYCFINILADSSLFIWIKYDQVIYVLVYFDDFIIGVSHQDEVHKFIHQVCTTFHCRDRGQLPYFLGLETITFK